MPLKTAKLPPIDAKVQEIAEGYVRSGSNKRGIAAVKLMLEKGFVTTDDLNELGYNHPPRAIADVRDAGIPVTTKSIKSLRSGRRMAIYRLGSATDIVAGRIAGRSALPKAFKEALIKRYGSKDCITGAALPTTVLQIDHRIPFRVAGDFGLEDRDINCYMLLDASSQRAKSWTCEACKNFRELLKPEICRSCYWASPEKFDHIAMEDIRRTDISWQGADVMTHDKLRTIAELEGLSLADFIKNRLRSI